LIILWTGGPKKRALGLVCHPDHYVLLVFFP
jgi:hypothetical protein